MYYTYRCIFHWKCTAHEDRPLSCLFLWQPHLHIIQVQCDTWPQHIHSASYVRTKCHWEDLIGCLQYNWPIKSGQLPRRLEKCKPCKLQQQYQCKHAHKGTVCLRCSLMSCMISVNWHDDVIDDVCTCKCLCWLHLLTVFYCCYAGIAVKSVHKASSSPPDLHNVSHVVHYAIWRNSLYTCQSRSISNDDSNVHKSTYFFTLHLCTCRFVTNLLFGFSMNN